MNNKIDWGLWDNTEEAGTQFPKLPVGPQVIKIVEVNDIVDRQLLVIKIDIETGDFKGHFTQQEKAFGEWPNQAIVYRSYKPEAYSFLKNFVGAVERSNEGYSFKKTNGDFQSFVGKKAVANFAEEEIPYADDNKNPIVVNKVREIRSTAALAEGKVKTITEVKPLKGDQIDEFKRNLANDEFVAKRQQETAPAPAPVTPAPAINDDDLPF